jgi:lysophospholipase L1-like esterase
MIDLILVLFTILAITILLLINTFYSATKLPKNNPNNFFKTKMIHKNALISIGDSITHGRVGANYVDKLEQNLGSSYEIVNAGINGNLVWNVNQRLQSILDCKPNVLTILIGTNDANATLSEENNKFYIKNQKLPQPPTIDWFKENLYQLVKECKRSNPEIKIFLCSIPTIGEDKNSKEFQHSVRFSEILKEVAKESEVNYVPINELMRKRLQNYDLKPKFPHEKNQKKIFIAIFKKYFLRQSWNKIAKNSGFVYHIDNLHLNDEGATIISDSIIQNFKKYKIL